jgi:hypothetical protein
MFKVVVKHADNELDPLQWSEGILSSDQSAKCCSGFLARIGRVITKHLSGCCHDSESWSVRSDCFRSNFSWLRLSENSFQSDGYSQGNALAGKSDCTKKNFSRYRAYNTLGPYGYRGYCCIYGTALLESMNPEWLSCRKIGKVEQQI